MTKIENMIDLRAFCLEQSVKIHCDYNIVSKGILETAREYEKYILDNSELPKSPMTMDRVLYETMLEMMESNDYNGKELEKLKETLANSKKE